MSGANLTLPSFAKINWFLRVVGKREDGYHELCTAFQTVSLFDTISFSDSEEISLTCDDPQIPLSDANLIIKSARALTSRFGLKKGASIHLEKRIPFPGGLGGGSSNAAITLLGLSCLWNLRVSGAELAEIGSSIGADVPFFLTGGTALGTGSGTQISPSREIEEKYIAIITPKVQIKTAKAFSELQRSRLTKNGVKSILQICCDDAERLESGQLKYFNDFENTIFKSHPEVRMVKKQLLDLGASKALLSGSGASVFGVFDNDDDRQVALESFEDKDKCNKYAVKTISRREYHKYLEPCKHLLLG